MTYSDAIIKRLTDLCVERGITTNKLATLSGKLIRLPHYPVLSSIIHYFQKVCNLL